MATSRLSWSSALAVNWLLYRRLTEPHFGNHVERRPQAESGSTTGCWAGAADRAGAGVGRKVTRSGPAPGHVDERQRRILAPSKVQRTRPTKFGLATTFNDGRNRERAPGHAD